MKNKWNYKWFKQIPMYGGRYFITENAVVSNKEGLILNGRRINKHGYREVCLSFNNKKIRPTEHRLVMAAFHGESKLVTDHINGNKLDNTLSNLRYCTARQNASYQNKKSNNNTSGYIGVRFSKRSWECRFRENGKRKYLYFNNQHDAIMHYNFFCIKNGDMPVEMNLEYMNQYGILKEEDVKVNVRKKQNTLMGVSLRLTKNGKIRYRARLCINNKFYNIGTFPTEEEANQAYIKFKEQK